MECIEGTDIGPYRLGRRVGSGGMSTVYAADDLRTGNRVAIKILDQESLRQADLALRFVQEARVGSRIHHANVVKVHDVGKTPWGSPFMVLDLLDGEDLQTYLERRPRLPWREACQLLRQLLTGLGAVHAHGVVHRDVKPENCFLDRRLGRLELKLIDFGIAQPPAECKNCQTGVKLILGTPNYMAPEQAIGKKVDGRADLYAAGVLFFRLLSGRLPYCGESPAEVISMHLREPIPSLYSVVPNVPVPRPFDRFLLKALSKEPSARFASAHDMIRALDEVVSRVELGADRRVPVPRSVPGRSWGDVVPIPTATERARFDAAPTQRLPGVAARPAARSMRKPAGPSIGRVALVAAATLVTFCGMQQAVEALEVSSFESISSALPRVTDTVRSEPSEDALPTSAEETVTFPPQRWSAGPRAAEAVVAPEAAETSETSRPSAPRDPLRVPESPDPSTDVGAHTVRSAGAKPLSS